MAHNAPGKHFREGLTLAQLFTMFPDDKTAEEWFVNRRWPDGIRRPHCDHDDVQDGAVAHSVREFARGPVHTNGIESLWSMFKRGYVGTYHEMSEAHLHRYVDEFTGRHNIRPLDTLEQMGSVVEGSVGKRLRYADLVAA